MVSFSQISPPSPPSKHLFSLKCILTHHFSIPRLAVRVFFVRMTELVGRCTKQMSIVAFVDDSGLAKISLN